MKRNILRGLAAVTALVVLGGGTAVAGDLIGSVDVKDNSLRSKDVRDGTIKKRDLYPALAQQLEPTTTTVNTGAQGATGPRGAAGANGEDGKDGVSGYEVRSWDYTVVSGGGIATMTCPVGKVALGGGYWLKDAAALTNGTTVVRSMPGVMDWNANQPKDTGDSAVDDRGWIIQVNKPANVNPGAMTVYVTCATMAG